MQVFKWHSGKRVQVTDAVSRALEQTAAAIVQDLYESETIPRDEGNLQAHTLPDYNGSKRGVVKVVSSQPYARRLYFHPEYHFRKDKNRLAGGMWFQPYLEGRGARWVRSSFAEFMRRQMP